MNNNSLAIPFAIVIAAGLIAGALFLTGEKQPLTNEREAGKIQEMVEVSPVGPNDHILGNPNAPIILVEYSDYDCPFCKKFHETMSRIITEYGADGRVAWVYRHFPLPQLHPNAPTLAQASECVAELGGNEAFWKFSDLIFAERGTNEQTDISRLPEFVEKSGIDVDLFETCLASGKYEGLVADSAAEAVASGATGTPHTIVIAGDQEGVISGAQPYATVKQIIDNLLLQLEGRSQ